MKEHSILPNENVDSKITSRAAPINGSRFPSKDQTMADELLRYIEHKVSSRAIQLHGQAEKSSHNTLVTHYKNACIELANHFKGVDCHMMAKLVMDKIEF